MLKTYTYTCVDCGTTYELELEENAVNAWNSGLYSFMDCFPSNRSDNMELLISGRCFDCWVKELSDD